MGQDLMAASDRAAELGDEGDREETEGDRHRRRHLPQRQLDAPALANDPRPGPGDLADEEAAGIADPPQPRAADHVEAVEVTVEPGHPRPPDEEAPARMRRMDGPRIGDADIIVTALPHAAQPEGAGLLERLQLGERIGAE